MIIRGKKVEIDGYTFDSKSEARRYGELKLLERIGEIRRLEVHPKWVLSIGGIKICTYEADYRYWHVARAWDVIEDVKPHRRGKSGKMLPIVNRDFRLRCNLLLALYGLTVEVVQ